MPRGTVPGGAAGAGARDAATAGAAGSAGAGPGAQAGDTATPPAEFRSSGRAPQGGGAVPPPGQRSSQSPAGANASKGRRVAILAAVGVVVVVAAAAVLLLTRSSGHKSPTAAATTGPTVAATTTTSVVTSGTLPVPSTQAWTDTSIDLDFGQHVSITATGTIQHNTSDPNAIVGPDGDTRLDLRQFNVPVNGAPMVANHAALIAKIGNGDPFVIGAAHDFDVNARGRLFLGVNDVGVQNNLGSFQAVIKVTTS